MRSEKGVVVWGAGEPGEVKTGAVGPVGSTGSVPCTELREGVGWATDVVAAGASAESVPPSMGMANPEAQTVTAAGEIDPRPVQPSVLATEAETRATNLPGEAERMSILIRGSCVRKS